MATRYGYVPLIIAARVLAHVSALMTASVACLNPRSSSSLNSADTLIPRLYGTGGGLIHSAPTSAAPTSFRQEFALNLPPPSMGVSGS